MMSKMARGSCRVSGCAAATTGGFRKLVAQLVHAAQQPWLTRLRLHHGYVSGRAEAEDARSSAKGEKSTQSHQQTQEVGEREGERKEGGRVDGPSVGCIGVEGTQTCGLALHTTSGPSLAPSAGNRFPAHIAQRQPAGVPAPNPVEGVTEVENHMGGSTTRPGHVAEVYAHDVSSDGVGLSSQERAGKADVAHNCKKLGG